MQESFAVYLLSLTLLFCIVANAAQNEFNVMDYGAKADGYTDDSLVTLDLISVMIFYS
jgi:polygalacturonase